MNMTYVSQNPLAATFHLHFVLKVLLKLFKLIRVEKANLGVNVVSVLAVAMSSVRYAGGKNVWRSIGETFSSSLISTPHGSLGHSCVLRERRNLIFSKTEMLWKRKGKGEKKFTDFAHFCSFSHRTNACLEEDYYANHKMP